MEKRKTNILVVVLRHTAAGIGYATSEMAEAGVEAEREREVEARVNRTHWVLTNINLSLPFIQVDG